MRTSKSNLEETPQDQQRQPRDHSCASEREDAAQRRKVRGVRSIVLEPQPEAPQADPGGSRRTTYVGEIRSLVGLR